MHCWRNITLMYKYHTTALITIPRLLWTVHPHELLASSNKFNHALSPFTYTEWTTKKVLSTNMEIRKLEYSIALVYGGGYIPKYIKASVTAGREARGIKNSLYTLHLSIRCLDTRGCWRHFLANQENSISDTAAEHTLDVTKPNLLHPAKALVLQKNLLFSVQEGSGYIRFLGWLTWSL